MVPCFVAMVALLPAAPWLSRPACRSSRPGEVTDGGCAAALTLGSGLAQDDPENARAAPADVVPVVRCPAVHECAVSLAQPIDLPIVAEHHVSLQHIEELLLAGLDPDLVDGDAPPSSVERGDDRANLALEQPRSQDHPALGGVLEGHE